MYTSTIIGNQIISIIIIIIIIIIIFEREHGHNIFRRTIVKKMVKLISGTYIERYWNNIERTRGYRKTLWHEVVWVNGVTQSPSNVLLTPNNLDLHGYKLQNGMHMKTQKIILFKYLPFYLNKSDNHDS